MPQHTERLAEVGPIDPRTGFPFWYEDSTGLRLELVWAPGDDFAPVVIDPEESGPLRDIGAFPGESFYLSAETRLPLGGGEDDAEARVILALEATFATEGVLDGQQIVFGRVRFRVDEGRPDTMYLLTHPYGTMTVTTDEDGEGSATEDIGLKPLDFEGALTSSIAPFLRWTPDPDLDFARYVGDGGSEHTVTGSPLGTNYAMVEGPGVGSGGGGPDPNDPTNPDKVYTDLFVLQGRVARTHGAEIGRAVYTRSAAGEVVVAVFARSIPGQQLTLAIPALPDTPMQGGEDIHYLARVDAGGSVPEQITVTNTTDPTPVPTTADVVDAVEITQADYSTPARTLTVAATSSDEQSPPALTVTGRGGLSGPVGVLTGLDAPPPVITVTSAAGGSSTRSVRVVG
ncbi:hypothetical protein E7Z53_00680 [Kocuria salina]|uniref:hypothetical protein n=1 Tax=Kocuria salina TaxID=1929416 RepID=UPI001593EAF7|nr:hypothetical protein [Kocuria salina]NVC21974.1 hypothetical protein [Kocuria salina]